MGGKVTPKETPAVRVPLIKIKQPSQQMIAIAKKWEELDAGKWDQEEEDVKALTEQERTSLVLSLSANRIYNHEGRPVSRTRREIGHSLQYHLRAEIIIGA